MTSILDVFTFESNELRVLGTSEDPLFVASDICKPMGLDPSVAVNGRMRTRKDADGDTIQYFEPGLDDDEIHTVIVSTNKGDRTALAVTEAGLYKLVFKSKTEIAKRFQRWVTHEVLPSIRKTGSYGVPQTDEDPIRLKVLASLDDIASKGSKVSSLDYIRLYEWHEKKVIEAKNNIDKNSDEYLAQTIEKMYNRVRKPLSASELMAASWSFKGKNSGWTTDTIRGLFQRLEAQGYGRTIGEGKQMKYEPLPKTSQLKLISG